MSDYRPDTSLLLEMLHYRRKHGTTSEQAFVDKFLMPMNPYVDDVGNIIVQIGRSPVMWSCHTDSVHREVGKQAIEFDQGMVSLAKGCGSSCLGADDAAGVFILHQMVKANVPGLYVFHRGEEVGGIGSKHIAKNSPGLLKGIDFAIALDRKGYSDIITHQGGRCCSDVFAKSLGDGLGSGWVADPTGIYTDTAEYTRLVSECTNLSVGYEGAHTSKETLDVWFVEDLLTSLVYLDQSCLVKQRDPSEVDEDEWAYGMAWNSPMPWDDPNTPVTEDLVSLVKKYPDAAADILEQYGYDATLFINEMQFYR